MLTLVLLPGMDGTGVLFRPFVAALDGAFDVRTIAYPTDVPLGYAELEARIRRLLPTENRFVVLAESFSGPIAMSLAASPPPGLAGVVLCCTFVRDPRPRLRFWYPLIARIPLALVPDAALSFFLLGGYSNAALRNSLAQAIARVSPKVWRERLRAVASADAASPPLQLPILRLQATRDRVLPESAAADVAGVFAQATVVAIEGPHLLLQARPNESAAIVADFLTSIDATVQLALSK